MGPERAPGGPAEQGETQPECPPGLRAVDGKQDRDQQCCKRQGKQPAVPDLVGLTQGGEANSDIQDDDQQAGDAEPESSHGTAPR